MKSTRFPVESFDPRYKRILLEAGLREHTYTFETEKGAARFQARIQLYRAAVRKADPEEAKRLYRARTSRKGKVVRIYPADMDFEDVLSTVGDKHVEELLPPPAAPATDTTLIMPEEPEPPTLDDIFADLESYKEPQP